MGGNVMACRSNKLFNEIQIWFPKQDKLLSMDHKNNNIIISTAKIDYSISNNESHSFFPESQVVIFNTSNAVNIRICELVLEEYCITLGMKQLS